MKLTFKDNTSVEITNNYFTEFDSNNNMIHYKSSSGIEYWKEYDSNNNMIHYKSSSGLESWNDSNGIQITKEQFDLNQKVSCENKVVEIDGIKYKLTLV